MNHYFDISLDVINCVTEIESDLADAFNKIETVKSENFYKVLYAMQSHRLSDRHFGWTTGYGYGDEGREITEKIYAQIFKAESALVRPQIVNGTHALTLGLNAILRPNDQMLSITGKPYDTLDQTIGLTHKNGSSLIEIGVSYDQIDLLASGSIDIDSVLNAITDKTKLIYIQRSSGYSFRKSLTIDKIAKAIASIKKEHPNILVMVDNCYGEFIEMREPIEIGANLCAGSLIKNPGGGLALTGGYLVGDESIIEKCTHKLTTPGIGKECGLTFGQTRQVLQGLFLAPQVVASALKGAIFTAKLFGDTGYTVKPNWRESRSDIIQAIKLGSRQKVIAFCKAIQQAAPVDAFVSPEPWNMPGYDSQVIMAAGTFVQGASIELSADAPIKEPYTVFFQGGLTYEHSKLGALMAYQAVKNLD